MEAGLRIAAILGTLFVIGCTKTIESPDSLSLPDASLLDDSETREIVSLRSEAYNLLKAQDYDGLEKLAAKDRSMVSPLGSGMSPFTCFYQGVEGNNGSETLDDFRPGLTAIKAWMDSRPDSISAKIAMADATCAYGWQIRGADYANTVSVGQWEGFGKQLQIAADLLQQVQPKRQPYPEWYWIVSQVAQGQSWNKDSLLAIAAEAAFLYPKNTEPYTQTIIFLLPRWYGSTGEAVNYATQSADRLGGDEGDILYARLAKTVWMYGCDTNVFEETGFSWPRVKHGMELICNRYPHSEFMANCFCVFAYQAHDHPAARQLFERLGDHYMDDAWYTRADFDKARAWAQ